MKITMHAAQRFLERVMGKENYNGFDIVFAKKYLERLLHDIVPTGCVTSFVLPHFKKYRAIYKEGNIVTIVPKERDAQKARKRYGREYAPSIAEWC